MLHLVRNISKRNLILELHKMRELRVRNVSRSYRNLIRNTVEPGYNDIGLYDTPSIESHILCYQINSSRLNVAPRLSLTTLAYNDTKYSVSFTMS